MTIMGKETSAKVRAILDRCAAIDWRKPAYDPEKIRRAYRRWLAATGVARPIRLVTDPLDSQASPFHDADGAWDFTRQGTGAVWMGFAGSPLVRIMSLTTAGGPFPPAPSADWGIAVAWACAFSLSIWRLDEKKAQDQSDLASMMAALQHIAEQPANLRAMVLLETPFLGLFDPPPRVASMVADLLAASDNEFVWQHLARCEGEFASGLNMNIGVLQQPPDRDEVIDALMSLAEPLIEACESGAFAHTFKDGELVVLTSPAIWADGRSLHRPDGPAIAWRETKVYAWKGCVLPEQFILQPQTITLDAIRAETDPRLQHALIDIYAHTHSYRRCMRDLGGVMVHEDDIGRLWCVNPTRSPLPAQMDDFRLLEVVNGTAEPDGSRKTYWLRVPPGMRSALEAVAWTYGMTPDEYRGLVVRT